MARILICHVPKDGSTARELGAALMGRGHFVSFDGEPDTPRAERAARLRQFEAVIVVWTEGSAQNAGLSEIARETLALNALVPVRAEELDKAKLPLTFRKLNMFAPRDVDGIARLVARLSTAATSLRNMAALAPRTEKVVARPEKPPRRAEREGQEKPPGSRADIGRMAAAPAAPASAPSQADGAPVPAPGSRPAPAVTRDTGLVPPVMQPAQSPVVADGTKVRVRPLSDLPEVPAPLAEAFADPEPAAPSPAAARSSRAAELSATLNPEHPPRDAPRPAVTAADLARAVDQGLLVSRIPDAMWLGEPVTVEIAIGREVLARLFPADMDAAGGHAAPDRQGIETLAISLYGHTDVFEIERQSERTQFVGPRQVLHGRDPATLGRWTWLVTPQMAGRQELVVRISALLRDRHGVPEPVALPDRRFEIAVDVPEGADLVPGLMGWHRT